MVMDELVFAAAGETDSQFPKTLVLTLVVNDTGAEAEKVTFCVKAVVEPIAAVGVQAVGLGVTVGGAVPVARIVALERVKAVIRFNKVELAETVPEETLVSGSAAGTAVIRLPPGIVTVAESVASGVPARSIEQSLMAMGSGAPTLSVRVTDTVDASQVTLCAAKAGISSVTATPVYVLVDEVDDVVELEGVIVWLKVAVAVTPVPFSFKGSESPATRFKVPLSV